MCDEDVWDTDYCGKWTFVFGRAYLAANAARIASKYVSNRGINPVEMGLGLGNGLRKLYIYMFDFYRSHVVFAE